MSGGSEPTSKTGRCACCTRTFTLRRSGPSNTALQVGTLYVPAHHAGQAGGPAQCEGSRKPPAAETVAAPRGKCDLDRIPHRPDVLCENWKPVVPEPAPPCGGSGHEQIDSMYGGDPAAVRRTDVPLSSLPFGRGDR